jgi:hypothetical protein
MVSKTGASVTRNIKPANDQPAPSFQLWLDLADVSALAVNY